MEYLERAAVPPEDKDDIALARDQMRRFAEAQRDDLRNCFPEQAWDFDVYDQKRYD